MVSIWWLIWAFVIGGYSGMLLISLLAGRTKSARARVDCSRRIACRAAAGAAAAGPTLIEIVALSAALRTG